MAEQLILKGTLEGHVSLSPLLLGGNCWMESKKSGCCAVICPFDRL